MECLLAFCWYLEAAIGVPVTPYEMAYKGGNGEIPIFDASGNYHGSLPYRDAGKYIGTVKIGTELGHGIFVELEHKSAADNTGDPGLNLLSVGFRKSFTF